MSLEGMQFEVRTFNRKKTKQNNTANLFSLFIVILGVQLLYVFLICIHSLQYK